VVPAGQSAKQNFLKISHAAVLLRHLLLALNLYQLHHAELLFRNVRKRNCQPDEFRIKKPEAPAHQTPFGVSIASSIRFLGQPGPWLTSMAFQPAPHAGQPSNSVCAE
jgi:hypothetical protein